MNNENKIATRQSYGEALRDLGSENMNVVALTADVSGSTKAELFEKNFPNRFFNCGISEQDMIATSAGFATCGKIPYASTFAVFATGRAYDQIRNSVCYPNLNVKICATHEGVTAGEDGATHQMFEDIALMRALPNMKVFSPADNTEAKFIVKEISKVNGPCYVRLSRYATPVIYDDNEKFEIGKAKQIGDGKDATIFATGICVSEAVKAMEELKENGVNVRVVDIHTIKPIDRDMIIKCAKETERLITVEDHSIIGGLGSAVCEVLCEEYPKHVVRLGIKDTFGMSGKTCELMEYYEIDSKAIKKAVLAKL